MRRKRVPLSSSSYPKLKKLTARAGDDRISRLSDDLLAHILSFLTLTAAVRTSILSERWKHLWRLLPSLDFTKIYPRSLSTTRRALSTMSAVLRRVEGPLSDVTLHFPYYSTGIHKRVDFCLGAAIFRRVRHCLTIVVSHPCQMYVMPLHYLNFSSLSQLHVSGVVLSQKHTFCLTTLKALHISCGGVLDVVELERLTSSACCPVLETLQLLNCNESDPLTVSLTNPTLKYLQIRARLVHSNGVSEICIPHVTRLALAGAWRAYALKDLSSLVEATFDFNVYPFPWGESDQIITLQTLKNLFNGMSSSVKIYISSSFLQVLHKSANRDRTIPKVEVKHVILKTGTDFSDILSLAALPRAFSKVEHLTINLSPKIHLNLNLCPSDCPCFQTALATQGGADAGKKYCMFLEGSLLPNYNLRTIVIEGFYGGNDLQKAENYYAFVRRSWQFEFVRILLRNSMKLEKMIIQSSPKQLKIPSQIAKMCCSLPKASSAAMLEFPYEEGSRRVGKEDILCSCKLTTSGSGDRLSELPDEMLLHILSFLSLRNAVLTTTLSKRWKKLWTMLPALDFTSVTSHFSFEEAVEIIDYVLAVHKGPKLSAFSLSFPGNRRVIDAKLDSWISFAVFRHVCRLDICLSKYVLPPYLFYYSNSLAQLKVSCCAIALPQHPFCLSSLKSMHISHAVLEQLVLERLTSSACCPVLEMLQITCCNNFVPFRISLTNPTLRRLCLHNVSSKGLMICAPHVTHLELHGKLKNTVFVLKDVSSLTNATIEFNDLDIATRNEYQALLILKYLITSLPPSIRVTLSRCVLRVFSVFALLTRGAALAKAEHLPLRANFNFDGIFGLAFLRHDNESLTLKLGPLTGISARRLRRLLH